MHLVIRFIPPRLEGYYEKMSGTSMATPFVAGALSLVKARYPDLSPSQLKRRILRSVSFESHLVDKSLAGGVLNLYNALENDDTSPAVVRDVRIVDRSDPTRIGASWRPSGDDGMEGKATRYVARVSGEPVGTEQDWLQARPVKLRAGGYPNRYQLTGIPLNFKAICLYVRSIMWEI